ncbi:hypothetical protein OKW43_005714 [Paraburkholderia sp. WC7.3g]
MKKTMVIRHAEKPVKGLAMGVDERGVGDNGHLTVRGWQRAGALARFFSPVTGNFAEPP